MRSVWPAFGALPSTYQAATESGSSCLQQPRGSAGAAGSAFGSCHASAAEFARRSLVLRGDVPVGRVSGQPVAQYLRSHGGLPPEQVPIVVDALRRVLVEVGSSGGVG